MLRTALSLCLVLAETLVASAVRGCKPITPKVFLQRLQADDYDKTATPMASAPPGTLVDVEVQFVLRNLKAVKESAGSYRAIGYLNTWWVDPRLAYADWEGGNCTSQVSLRGMESFRTWHPDLYIDNLVLREKYSDLDVSIARKIYPNGTVYTSTYRVINARIKYGLIQLPRDQQTGSMVIGSYSYSANVMKLRPRSGSAEAGESGVGCTSPGVSNKVWVIGKFSSNHEELVAEEGEPFSTPGNVSIDPYPSGDFSQVIIRWQFTRKPAYFFSQVLYPSFLIVVVCYLQFWVNPDAVPARAALATFPILMIRGLCDFVYTILPKGAQRMWMSEWLLIALTVSVLSGLTLGPVQACRALEKRRAARFQVLESNRQGLLSLIKSKDDGNKSFAEVLHRFMPVQVNPEEEEQVAKQSARRLSVPAENAASVRLIPSTSTPNPSMRPKTSMKKQAAEASERGVTQLHLGVFQIVQLCFDREDRDKSGDLGVAELQRVFRNFDIYMSKRVLASAACAFLRDQNWPNLRIPASDEEETVTMQPDIFCAFMLEAMQYLGMYKLAVPTRGFIEHWNSVASSEMIDLSMRVIYPIIILVWFSFQFGFLVLGFWPYCVTC